MYKHIFSVAFAIIVLASCNQQSQVDLVTAQKCIPVEGEPCPTDPKPSTPPRFSSVTPLLDMYPGNLAVIIGSYGHKM